jgi:hypothetical protein
MAARRRQTNGNKYSIFNRIKLLLIGLRHARPKGEISMLINLRNPFSYTK